MDCYFQGCTKEGTTKEHIPPRSFFPVGEKEQLLTVRSCPEHNNSKSSNDLYVLAHICMNASPSNRAREVFMTKVAPQLEFNNGALRKRIAAGCVPLPSGAVAYNVDVARFDEFFTALSCGIVFKCCSSVLPSNYSFKHIYHSFSHDEYELKLIEEAIATFYSGRPLGLLEFGDPDTRNERIYTVKLFGVPDFKSSITIVHEFFGKFKATSMLTRQI